MIAPACYLSTLSSLGHLSRPARIALLRAACLTIHEDRCQHGPDVRLLTLGTALEYCASLLVDAGADAAGDAADQALARLDDEVLVLLSVLRAAAGRGDPGQRRLAAHVLTTLFPEGQLPDSMPAVRGLLRRSKTLDVQIALDQIGCRPYLHRMEEAIHAADGSLDRCRASGAADELRQRARDATRSADLLLRRVQAHIESITEPGDSDARARAAALLRPLRAGIDPAQQERAAARDPAGERRPSSP